MKLYGILNNHILTVENQVKAKSKGYPLVEVEQGYDGLLYEVGYAPEKPVEVKQEEVRTIREQYFEKYVDWYQSKSLLWEEMSDEEKEFIAEYRQYLKDYTKQEDWYEQNPDDYETWLVAHHPVVEEQ